MDSFIRPLIAAGKTDSEIVQELQDDPRHYRDAMVTSPKPAEVDLLELLTDTFPVLRLTKDAVWSGPLVDYFDQNPSDPAADGFEVLLTHLQISNRPLPAFTKPHIGKLVTQVAEIVGGLVSNHQAVEDAITALTGGPLFEHLTEAYVASRRATMAADDLRAEVEDALNDNFHAALNAPQPDREALAAGLEAAASQLRG